MLHILYFALIRPNDTGSLRLPRPRSLARMHLAMHMIFMTILLHSLIGNGFLISGAVGGSQRLLQFMVSIMCLVDNFWVLMVTIVLHQTIQCHTVQGRSQKLFVRRSNYGILFGSLSMESMEYLLDVRHIVPLLKNHKTF